MPKYTSYKYIIIYFIIWTFFIVLLFFHERNNFLKDAEYFKTTGHNYEEFKENHLTGDLYAHLIVWVFGSGLIVFFNDRSLKLKRKYLSAEDKLILTSDKFKTVFDNGKDHMYVLKIDEDEQYIITDVNQSALSELGYTAKELTGKPVDMIIEDANAISRKERLKMIRDGQQLTFEIVKIRKDGTKFPVEASVKMVKIGNENYFHSVERNIEGRRKHEEELMAAKIKAEESDRLKSAFLANMSHEIRTPMNGILGFAQLLQNNHISEQKRSEYLDIINKSGSHLIKLINDIIDISKLETNKMIISKRKFKLNSFLSDIIYFFKPMLKEGVDLTLQTALDDSDDIIITDDTRLKQILTNLIGNSSKFTESGSINVSYSLEDKGKLLFEIRDTGIGMTEDELKFVFNRFRQADEETSRKYGGTGLGLAISKACVKLLGGKIWVESEKNKGSSFYFSIPYVHVLNDVP